ncbi:MAG: hypothetical protein KIT87_12090 [Anaerolineae bacterium]|nr:hypothetical protein [Anaerolineae bacterium]
MLDLKERYVMDKDGNRVAVQLDMQTYERLLAEVEAARGEVHSNTTQSGPSGTSVLRDVLPSYRGQTMTLEEMKRHFTGEWVLIGEPETTESLMVIRGIVIWHSRSRDEISEQLAEAGVNNAAIWYFPAPRDDNTLVIL